MLLIWLVIAHSTIEDKDYNDLSDRDWDAVARIFPGKGADQCKARWQSLLKINLTKAPWTQDEDRLLTSIIQEKGPKKWKEIAFELNKKMEPNKTFRQGKQCRERWINHLDPTINRGIWTNEEDVRLLEVHLQVGKKWAEIAKILKTRTENAVKNRWNSLMKKYKGEYGVDIDSISASSGYSNKSMDDLERKVSEMIISNKKRAIREGGSPDSINPDRILEVPEEDSPEYNSDFNTEPPMHGGNNFMPEFKRDEDFSSANDFNKNNQKKTNNKKKPLGGSNALLAKGNLMNLINEDISLSQPFPQKNNSVDSLPMTNASEQSGMDDSQQVYMFGNNNRMNGNNNNNSTNMLQESLMGANQGMNNMNMMGQQGKDPRLYNMTNDILGLNMWRNNLNNYNVFGGQNTPQQNLLGLYNQGTPQQNTFNLAPASLPGAENFGNQQQQQKFGGLIQPSNNIPIENENKLIKLNEAKFETQEEEGRTFKLTERPFSHLNNNEANNNNNMIFYAVVDLSGGNLYLMDQVNKDNYPPPAFMQNPNKAKAPVTASSLNNFEFIGSSPALNHNSWTSPPLHTSTLMNYPLFNNPLTNFGFAAKQFSPNINLFHESPKFDSKIFGSTPKMEGSDWTPETLNRPLFANLGMKQRPGATNSRGDTPPDVSIGANNGAFLRRINDKPVPSRGMMAPNQEGLKYSSPSSFLQSSHANYQFNRNKA